MLNFNFSAKDIALGCLLAPIMIPYHFLKTTFINKSPRRTKQDNEILDTFYELLEDEVVPYIEMMSKGPTFLKRFKIVNSYPIEMHIDLKHGSTEFKEQHRITFGVKRAEKYFTFGTGGNSASGYQMFDKDKLDSYIEDIMRSIYWHIERSWPRGREEYFEYSKKYDEWFNNSLLPILNKYGLDKQDYIYFTRRAHIMNMKEANHPKYIKAKEELLKTFNEQMVEEFIKDIDDVYTTKAVTEALS